MVKYSTSIRIKEVFSEIFHILAQSDAELNEVWHEISKIKSFKTLDEQECALLIDELPFLKRERWNHVAINKISFILEAMEFLQKDLRDLSNLLSFHDFETLIQEILKINGYFTTQNFYFSDKSTFKHATKQKRYEIDVIGFKNPHVLCIDAKQWKRKDSFSSINKAANLQLQRILALKENPETFSSLLQSTIGISSRTKINFPLMLIPIIVTLEENGSRFNAKDVPLVSIYRLNAFLQEITCNIPYLRIIKISKIYRQKRII